MESGPPGELGHSRTVQLCKTCSDELWRAVGSLVANRAVSVEPAPITPPPPPATGLPDDHGDEPLYRPGDRVVMISRSDPRMPDWAQLREGDTYPDAPATVDRFWRILQPGPWVYGVRLVADPSVMYSPLTAYQLRPADLSP